MAKVGCSERSALRWELHSMPKSFVDPAKIHRRTESLLALIVIASLDDYDVSQDVCRLPDVHLG